MGTNHTAVGNLQPGCGYPTPVDNAVYPPTMVAATGTERIYQYTCNGGYYDASGNNGTVSQLSCTYSSQSGAYAMDSSGMDLLCSGASPLW